MIRAYLIGGLIAAILAAISYAYFSGGRNAADQAERDALERAIESGGRFNEGADNTDGVGWYDRLFPDAAAAD